MCYLKHVPAPKVFGKVSLELYKRVFNQELEVLHLLPVGAKGGNNRDMRHVSRPAHGRAGWSQSGLVAVTDPASRST